MTGNTPPAPVSGMLVSLDCILDVRLGTIATLSKEAHSRIMASPEYYTRLRDSFDGIDKEAYDKAYAARGAESLAYSMVTPIISLISDFVTKTNSLLLNAPIASSPKVDVNFFPFTPPENVRNIILKSIQFHVNERFDISAVCIDPKHITFDYVRMTYDHVVMYDAGEWLDAQVEDGKLDRAIPNVTIIGPILNRGKEDLTQDELFNGAVEVAEMFAPLFNLVLMPVEAFCTAMNPNRLNLTSRPEGPEVGDLAESKSDDEVKPNGDISSGSNGNSADEVDDWFTPPFGN